MPTSTAALRPGKHPRGGGGPSGEGASAPNPDDILRLHLRNTAAVATGAGAHVAIGTAVVGGMVVATILVIFMFFVLLLRLFRVRPKSQTAPSELALIAPAPQSGN